MSPKDFLIRAENYTTNKSRDEHREFGSLYLHYRLNHTVRESVWMALDNMYGQDVANLIEQETAC